MADIQTRAGKVQGRVIHLQEKVQKYNPKKEKLRKFANNLIYVVHEELYFLAPSITDFPPNYSTVDGDLCWNSDRSINLGIIGSKIFEDKSPASVRR